MIFCFFLNANKYSKNILFEFGVLISSTVVSLRISKVANFVFFCCEWELNNSPKYIYKKMKWRETKRGTGGFLV